ncbi:MAG: DUF3795 domain-containing protein [Methanomassiliicoccales archaeon]|nr:DUF3795 domain-containing protein [Methanomassiliicoccales archaeon]
MIPFMEAAVKLKGHRASMFLWGGRMGGSETGRELAAYCGLYCGSCETFRAWKDKDAALLMKEAEESGRPVEEIRCDGCKSSDVIFWCRQCKIKDCAVGRGFQFCSECGDFPCRFVLEFEASRLHHEGVISELRRIREIGVDEWLAGQDRKWRCPSCSGRITFYDERCRDCGSVIKDG